MDDRSTLQSDVDTVRPASRVTRLLRGMRGHVARALVPAVALAVVAGGTAGAVTVVALSGAEVASTPTVVATRDESSPDTAESDDVGTTDGAPTAPDAVDGATAVASADAASDADTSEENAGEPDEAPALSLEETVARYGAPDYAAILSRRFPGAQWSLNGSAYAGLRWLDGGTVPSRAELDALWPEVAATLARERAARVAADAAAAAAREAELEARRNDPTVQALLDSFDPRTIWGPEPDYSAILSRRYPGAQWSLNGNDPTGGLVWHDGGNAPTKAQLDAMWAEVAREMALEMDPRELERHAGVGEQVYVDGVLRPKGWVGGKDDPQPAGSVDPGVDYRFLPQIPHTNGGSPVGTIDVLKDPTGSQNFEQRYGMDLTDLAERIAAAHGYFGGSSGLGLSLNGDRELMWYSDQVDPSIVEQVLADIGAVPAPVPEPEPEPETAPEPTPEPAPAPGPEPEPGPTAEETATEESPVEGTPAEE